jgi:dolichyl-phosphate beta-glucosyltransferase
MTDATSSTQKPLSLSVVVPAYNEQTRIVLTLRRILDFLEAHHPASEVIVSDDGSTDDTPRIVEELARSSPRLRLLRDPVNRGKGAAVRRGVMAAQGEWILFSDADLSTPIEEVDKLLVYGKLGADIVIGSRGLSESDIRTRQPLPRELMGRGFNVIVRSVLLGGFRDTQCGFKLFRKQAAHELFPQLTVDGFAFDVEVLLLAKERRLRIDEVPVVWYHAPNSKVSPVTDAARMFGDLVKLRAKRFAKRMSR